MSTTQAGGDVRPLIETHRRKESASVLFTPPVVEKFPDFESRKCLVEALADEINTIPSDIIPYGSLFYRDMIFVYQSRWDEEENMFFIAVDLATHAIEIGQIELPEEEGEADTDNGPVTLH